MEFTIKSKKILHIAEWNNQLVINDLDEPIIVDLGHTEMLAKTITIKKGPKERR
ncbi:MAG: hypothetical protein KAX30_07855 [Candidatus Atribacteria bacterium]|nr:hypothetical protein [Candidatus Atribacteria bacterium]